MSEVSKLVLTFFMMSEARWRAGIIIIKLPVKRAPWFSVHNWQVASCKYKQYCDVVFAKRIYREKGSQFDENMKKYN